MITWQLKKITLRYIERGATIDSGPDTPWKRKHRTAKIFVEADESFAHLFIIAHLQDDTEKLLYEFSGKIDNEIKQQLFELAKNNAKALITCKDDSAPILLKQFSHIKMKNFRDVDIEIEKDVVPLPFGKYIGQNVKNISKLYKKRMMEGNMASYIKSFPKLEKYF